MKSDSSFLVNNEILLPNRCHEGHQGSKSPVFTGFFEPMQSFPLNHVCIAKSADISTLLRILPYKIPQFLPQTHGFPKFVDSLMACPLPFSYIQSPATVSTSRALKLLLLILLDFQTLKSISEHISLFLFPLGFLLLLFSFLAQCALGNIA